MSGIGSPVTSMSSWWPEAEAAQIDRLTALASRVSLNFEAPCGASLQQIAPEKSFSTTLHNFERVRSWWCWSGPSELTGSPQIRCILAALGHDDAVRGRSESRHRPSMLDTVTKLRAGGGVHHPHFSAFRPISDTPMEAAPATPVLREHRSIRRHICCRAMASRRTRWSMAPGEPAAGCRPQERLGTGPPEQFPVEIQPASYEELVRVPGIGPVAARRVVAERGHTSPSWPGRPRALSAWSLPGPADFSLCEAAGFRPRDGRSSSASGNRRTRSAPITWCTGESRNLPLIVRQIDLVPATSTQTHLQPWPARLHPMQVTVDNHCTLPDENRPHDTRHSPIGDPHPPRRCEPSPDFSCSGNREEYEDGDPWTGIQSRDTGPDSATVANFLDALEATAPTVCQLAVSTLGNNWNHRTGEHQEGLLTGEPSQESARQALSRPVTDPAGFSLLGRTLGHRQTCVRHAAARMLGQSGSAEAVRLLRSGLHDTDATVRESAALGLADAEDPAALRDLTKALKDRSIDRHRSGGLPWVGWRMHEPSSR